jgi:transcription elongation factor GreA
MATRKYEGRGPKRENLTKSDVQKIKEEIAYREITLGPKLKEDLKEARAQGDLSENFEYYAAKRANNRNNSRIRYLENMLSNANIIEDSSGDDEVGINSLVTVYFENRDKEEKYKIVTSIRANSIAGLISIESPVGKALLHHKVGDRVEIRIDDTRSFFVVIRDLQKDLDDSGDAISSY